MTLTIFFSSPGTYIIDDDGIRGNNASAVRDANGNILFPFTHPADSITFIAEVPGELKKMVRVMASSLSRGRRTSEPPRVRGREQPG